MCLITFQLSSMLCGSQYKRNDPESFVESGNCFIVSINNKTVAMLRLIFTRFNVNIIMYEYVEALL